NETARNTVFCATVNDSTFLKEGENRRFPVISVSHIEWEKMCKIDMMAVWGYAVLLYEENRQSFRLTKEERALFVDKAKQYVTVTDEFQTIYDTYGLEGADWEDKDCMWWSATEISFKLGGKLSPVKIGKALRRAGFTKDSTTYKTKVKDGVVKYRLPQTALVGDKG
ncbi:MAG: VapE family protein, partial [Niameybacter sp.]